MPGDRQKQPPQPIAFGKYTLLERISHGGMAEVFRARTMGEGGFEQIVAIKLLLPQVAQDRDFVTMMIDEAKIAGQLSHANIAQIFDLGQLEGRYYIVQEYIDGRDVRTILRNMVETGRKLDLPAACHIMSKICEGLDYAHKKRDSSGRPLNLVHRDVSPQNVLVSYEGEVKVIDFGIVKAEGRQTQTLAGLVKGKFAYMSPEQLRGLPVDRRTDVFACGILLHELLTGYPLFKRATDFDTLQRARSGEIEPPSKQNPHVPEGLDRITLKALARHVDDRYQAASELRDALWEFVRSSGNLYSREELSGWMRKTFPKGDARAATATPSPVKSAAPGKPGDVLAPTSEMEAVVVPDAPAPPKVVGSPVPPPREPPRGKYEPPPRLDYDDSDEDGEGDNMTLVDPELHVRMVDGARESATIREQRITDDELRATVPGSQQALRELAMAAQADPERAVFTSGPDARITSSSDAVSAFERGGPGSELDQNTPLPQGWQEQMTPTKQRRRAGDPAPDGVSETASTSPFMPAARVGNVGQPMPQDDPLMKTMPRVTKRPDPFDRPTMPAEAGYPRVSFREAGGDGGGGASVNRNTVPRDRTPAPAPGRPGYESTSPPPGMGPPMPSPMPGPPHTLMGPPMQSPMPGPPHGMMGPPMQSPMPGPMGSPPGLAPPMQSPMPGPPMYSPMPGPPMGMHAPYDAAGMGPPARGRNFYLVIGAIALLVVAATLSIVLAASNG